MMAKIFWAVVAFDGIAAVVLWRLFASGTHGLLVAIFLFVIGVLTLTACSFPLLRSDGWRIAALLVLLLASVPLIATSILATAKRIQEQRQFSGSAYFQGPALSLAQALVRQDLAAVKQLIPAAGDLNQPHGGGTSLWQFGVLQSGNSEEAIDLLRVLLTAGADPKRDTSADTLLHALATGARLTQFLMEAGANPYVLDSEQRPVWWRAMQPGEDEAATERLRLMLDHGADLKLRAPDGRGPVGHAVANRNWYVACLLIERGAEWKQEKLSGGSLPELLEWEILRRDEYPIPVPDLLRKVLADLKGEPVRIPAASTRGATDIRIPDLLRATSFDTLDSTRTALAQLAAQPDWVRRVTAFFEDGDSTQRDHVALLLSLKPEALPEAVQERCWSVLKQQVAWYDSTTASSPGDRNGWLLKETAVIAVGLASIPGPVRDRHRADFTGLLDRIEACRKANDPDAAKLADLKAADWKTGTATGPN